MYRSLRIFTSRNISIEEVSESHFLLYNLSINQSSLSQTRPFVTRKDRDIENCLRHGGERFSVAEGSFSIISAKIGGSKLPAGLVGLIIPELIKIRLERRRNKGQRSESIRPPESILTRTGIIVN